MNSASDKLERPYKGEQEAGSEESERISSLSSADLQADTRWECFLQATFLMILSSDGPRTHPHLEQPPRLWLWLCEPPDILRQPSSYRTLTLILILILILFVEFRDLFQIECIFFHFNGQSIEEEIDCRSRKRGYLSVGASGDRCAM